MHSSRAAFSSLQTQQGLGFVVAVPSVGPEGLLEAARLLTWERESEARRGVSLVWFDGGFGMDGWMDGWMDGLGWTERRT
jgi:hypothetical protein